jgi:hypothetical protein
MRNYNIYIGCRPGAKINLSFFHIGLRSKISS